MNRAGTTVSTWPPNRGLSLHPDEHEQKAEAHRPRLGPELVLSTEAAKELSHSQGDGHDQRDEEGKSDEAQVGEDLDVGVVDGTRAYVRVEDRTEIGEPPPHLQRNLPISDHLRRAALAPAGPDDGVALEYLEPRRPQDDPLGGGAAPE